MSDCTRGDIRDRLPELLHGTLDASARAEAERHVHDCPTCREELALLAHARAALSRAPRVDAARIAAAIERAARVPAVSRGRAPWTARHVAALAAALLVMLTGAVIALSLRGPESRVAQTQAPAVRDVATESVAVETPAPRPLAEAPPAPAPGTPRMAAPDEEPVSLAFAGADLGEAELESLLADLGSLDGMPDADPAALLPDIPVEVQ